MGNLSFSYRCNSKRHNKKDYYHIMGFFFLIALISSKHLLCRFKYVTLCNFLFLLFCNLWIISQLRIFYFYRKSLRIILMVMTLLDNFFFSKKKVPNITFFWKKERENDYKCNQTFFFFRFFISSHYIFFYFLHHLTNNVHILVPNNQSDRSFNKNYMCFTPNNFLMGKSSYNVFSLKNTQD